MMKSLMMRLSVTTAVLAFSTLGGADNSFERFPSLLAAKSAGYDTLQKEGPPRTFGGETLEAVSSWVWYFVAPPSIGGAIRLLPERVVLEGNLHILIPTVQLDHPSVIQGLTKDDLYDRMNWWFPSLWLPGQLAILHQKPRPLLQTYGKTRTNKNTIYEADPFFEIKRRLVIMKPGEQKDGTRALLQALPEGDKDGVLLFDDIDAKEFIKTFDAIQKMGFGGLMKLKPSVDLEEIVWRMKEESPRKFFACYFSRDNSWYLSTVSEKNESPNREAFEEVQDCISLGEVLFTSKPLALSNGWNPSLSLDLSQEHVTVPTMPPPLTEETKRFGEYTRILNLPYGIWVTDPWHKNLFLKWLWRDSTPGKAKSKAERLKRRYRDALKVRDRGVNRGMDINRDVGKPDWKSSAITTADALVDEIFDNTGRTARAYRINKEWKKNSELTISDSDMKSVILRTTDLLPTLDLLDDPDPLTAEPKKKKVKHTEKPKRPPHTQHIPSNTDVHGAGSLRPMDELPSVMSQTPVEFPVSQQQTNDFIRFGMNRELETHQQKSSKSENLPLEEEIATTKPLDLNPIHEFKIPDISQFELESWMPNNEVKIPSKHDLPKANRDEKDPDCRFKEFNDELHMCESIESLQWMANLFNEYFAPSRPDRSDVDEEN